VGTVDPLGGAFAIESLTLELERRVDDYLSRIDAMGGAVQCINNGFYHRELAEAGYRYQLEIERGDRVIVGVNAYQAEQGPGVPIFKTDPEVEPQQIAKLRALRETRDNALVRTTLAGVVEAARARENVIPALIGAVKAYATVGEICDALRTVYGTYRASRVI